MGAVVSLSFTSRMNMHGACICIAVSVAQMHKKSAKPFTKDDLGIERYGKKKSCILFTSCALCNGERPQRSGPSFFSSFFFSASRINATCLAVNNETYLIANMHIKFLTNAGQTKWDLYS